jgi:hypothetical protein
MEQSVVQAEPILFSTLQPLLAVVAGVLDLQKPPVLMVVQAVVAVVAAQEALVTHHLQVLLREIMAVRGLLLLQMKGVVAAAVLVEQGLLEHPLLVAMEE